MKIKMYMLKILNFVHTLAFLSLSLWLKMSFIKSSSWRSILVLEPSALPPISVSRADTESDIDIDMQLFFIYFRDFGSACVYLFWAVSRVLCLSIGLARVLYIRVLTAQFIATSASCQLTDVIFKKKIRINLYQNYILDIILSFFKC